jgi:predicted porin
MAKTYEDIGKDATEFISKGFPNSGSFKITTETKAPHGVSIKTTGERTFVYIDKDNFDEKLSAVVEPKLRQDVYELSAKLSTANNFEGALSVENLGTPGTKVSATAIQSDDKGPAAKGNASFKNDLVHVKGGVEYPFTGTHVKLAGEISVRHDQVHIGVDAKYDKAHQPSETSKDKLALGLKGGYVSKEQQLVVSFENQPNSDKKTSKTIPHWNIFGLSYLHSLSEYLRFGFGIAVEQQNNKPTEVHVATEYKVDKELTLKKKISFVAAKDAENRELRVVVAAKQNLNERVSVTVGADINARAVLGTHGKSISGTKPHSFGFEVKFQ